MLKLSLFPLFSIRMAVLCFGKTRIHLRQRHRLGFHFHFDVVARLPSSIAR